MHLGPVQCHCLDGRSFCGEHQVKQANPATFTTISQATERAGAGDTVVVRPGVYRESIRLRQSGTPDAPIRFVAEKPGTVVLTGADVVSHFKHVDGAEPIFAIPWQHVFAIDHQNGKAIEFHPDSAPVFGRAEQVIADDRQLLPCKDLNDLRAAWSDRDKRLQPPVKNLGGPFTGLFAVDTTYHILYLWLADGSDPNTHVMQASTRSQLFGVSEFESDEGVHDIDVSGFIFRYAANFPQRAAVVLHGSHNSLHNCLIEKMAGTGVSVAGSMTRCLIRDNGFCGGAVEGDNFTANQCVWENNCWKPIDRNWEAGGAKVCDSRHGEFANCIFRRNGGPGLWFDIDCRDISVHDCAFIDNELSGLFIEISDGIRAENNLVTGNAIETVGQVPGEAWSVGGIQIGESRNCVVTNNTCIDNKDGISLREIGPRTIKTRGVESTYHTSDNTITGNTIAKSHGYAIALWWDNAFFGAHPSQADKYKNPEDWQAHLRELGDGVYDPANQKLSIDGDTFTTDAKFLFGVPWRPNAKKLPTLSEFTKATGFEKDGKIADQSIAPQDSVDAAHQGIRSLCKAAIAPIFMTRALPAHRQAISAGEPSHHVRPAEFVRALVAVSGEA